MFEVRNLLVLSLVIVLAACTQENKDYPKPPTTDRPIMEVEQPDFTLIEDEPVEEGIEEVTNTEEEPNLDPIETPVEIEIPTFSMKQLRSKLGDFKFNNDDQYLSCAYYALQQCESQVVYSKTQEEKDPELCDLLADGEKDICKDNLWRELSLMENDVSLCGNIQEGFTQQDCKNSYYLSQAIEEKDPEICNKIEAYVDQSYELPVVDTPEGVDPEEPAAFPTPEPPENYLLEECKNQVQFALEYETQSPELDEGVVPDPVEPVVDPATPEIIEVEVVPPEAEEEA